MPPAASPVPDYPEDDTRWRVAGERIQTLLDASAAGGSVARNRAEQLVREVTDLYGAGLDRMLRTAAAADPGLAEAFAADDLVASLLLVHGLHPHPVERRIADALDGVRPYLGSHGGDVHLLEVDGAVVRLSFAGSCKSCPSSAVTLELAIEDAVRAAAPEISSIEVVTAPTDSTPNVIPAQSLLTRVRTNGHRHASWQPVAALAELAPGEVGGFAVAGTDVVACRIGDEFFAYRDQCANCAHPFTGATLAGAVLRCPQCGTDFDVVHAGAGTPDPGGGHLEPIPVLVRDGVPSMALAEEFAS
ncbi:NifU family protein [Mycobacterium sp. NPDC050441]|uniref:NifU family protein n=1 Tax=Mycobacterium sp. NPDC050441 TaxID=3155403 RepID=UPI0033ED6DA7